MSTALSKPRTSKKTAPKKTTPVAIAQVERRKLEYVDPKTLVVGANARTVVQLDDAFLNSIADQGVMTAILAHRDDAGALVVDQGQRRTLAAVKVGLAEVPVLVGTKPVEDTRRIVGQVNENDRRDQMTAGDRANAFEQLTAFGMSAGDIVKTGVATAEEVKAASAVVKSAKARQVSETHALTLPQAAVVAQFEDDDQAVNKLLSAATTGQFEHEAQRQRDKRTSDQFKEALTAQAKADGYVIIPEPYWDNKNTAQVEKLRDRDGNKISLEDHAKCPGHSAYITTSYGDKKKPYEIRLACRDLKANHHYIEHNPKLRAADMTELERTAAKTQRADIKSSNLAWDSAETVRRAWLTKFANGKTAPKGAAKFVVQSLARADHELFQALKDNDLNTLGRELLGLKTSTHSEGCKKLAEQVARASDARAQMIGLVLILAAYENRTGRHSWRGTDPTTTRYLQFLVACGYALSEVERRAAGLPEAEQAEPTSPSTPEPIPAVPVTDPAPADEMETTDAAPAADLTGEDGEDADADEPEARYAEELEE